MVEGGNKMKGKQYPAGEAQKKRLCFVCRVLLCSKPASSNDEKFQIQ